MKSSLIATLRDRSLSIHAFRKAADQLATIVASESKQFASPNPILITILRAGLVMIPPFLQTYPHSPVGLFGMRRDEATATAQLYYQNLPPLSSRDPIFLLDPMLATGGSVTLAVDLLKKAGADEERMIVFSIFAAPEGIQFLANRHPSVRTHLIQVDQRLDDKKFIVPGLGDFGDRYFGTV